MRAARTLGSLVPKGPSLGRWLRAADASSAWRPVEAATGCVAARHVGTQTAIFRMRTEAYARGSTAIAARRTNVCVDRGAQGLVPAEASFETAESLAAKAHAAALGSDTRACLLAVWALKDLPRERSVVQAVDKPRRDDSGEAASTLLQAVASAGFQDSVDLLLELQPKSNLKDGEGRTALHFATSGNHSGVAQSLLACGGANIDARDAAGRTALHVAVDQGHADMTRLLMNFGANPFSAAGDKRTPYEIAKSGGGDNAKLANFMKRHWDRRKGIARKIGRVRKFKVIGEKPLLPSHVVAPPLKLGSVGYLPEENGEVAQLKRGIRNTKKRAGPSNPPCIVNWYSPRG